jgi:glycosyltransferase involved in cell wall biosynthesis
VSSELWEKHIGIDAHKPLVVVLTQEEQDKQHIARAPYYEAFVSQARAAIQARCEKPNTAIVCVTLGGMQWAAVSGLDQFVVEAGIGYFPQGTHRFRVFESNAWAHMIYGKEGKTAGDFWQDAVIPNATDPRRFEFRTKKDDYFLVLGRMNADKGVGIAVDVCERLGKRLILAGTPGLAAVEATKKSHVEFRPNVSEFERKELLAGARGMFAPTRYPEPFGAVVIEAGMSGTPVISTDWGAFAETVLHGITGYRCRNMDQFLRAVRSIDRIDPAACRSWALENFSLDAVIPLWNEYLRGLLALSEPKGWYTDTGSSDATWLRRVYPAA